MKKLPAVEEARAIMKEGMEWGVWKWLMEKKRVREIADHARTALDELEIQVKLKWPDEYKLAYNELVSEDEPKRGRKPAKNKKSAAGSKSDRLQLGQRVTDDRASGPHHRPANDSHERERGRIPPAYGGPPFIAAGQSRAYAVEAGRRETRDRTAAGLIPSQRSTPVPPRPPSLLKAYSIRCSPGEISSVDSITCRSLPPGCARSGPGRAGCAATSRRARIRGRAGRRLSGPGRRW